jgi:hypothetical protein
MQFNQARRAASRIGFVAAVFLGTLAGAQAGIIDHGPYLTDSITGLDWLDLTATQGLSYTSVSSALPTGGWHYATLANVSTLFTDAGGTGPYNFSGGNGNALVQGAATSLLISLMGDTSPFGLPGGAGLTSDIDISGGGGGPFPHFLAVYTDLPPTTDYLLVPFGTRGANIADRSVGSFLIRNTKVPEPVTLSLFGTGLAGAIGLRRRRKKPA